MLRLPFGFRAWLHNYLHGRTQRIRLKSTLSHQKQVGSGVPQGSLLGPYLFNAYCFDLNPIHHDTFIMQYADDICEVIEVKQQLQPSYISNLADDELNNIRQWGILNGLTFNESKSFASVFPKKNSDVTELTLPIRKVSEFKLLGVIWSSNLLWQSHFRVLESRCARRLYFLRLLRPVLNHDELWKVYETLIESVLLYCSPLFGSLDFKSMNIIDRLWRRARRIICPKLCNCKRYDNSIHEKRLKMIRGLFSSAQSPTHPLHSIVQPMQNDRVLVPYSHTNRRRNCFTVFSTIVHNDLLRGIV